VSQARNFCSKVWQSSRFVLTNLEKLDASEFGAHDPPAAQSLEDRWIFSRLAAVTSAVNQGLASYDLDVATRSLHEFVWNEFCDWYIELAKPRLASSDPSMAKNLRVILDTMLRLLHPFIPFLTEEIWRQLPGSGEALMVAEFPKSHPTDQDAGAEAAMASVIDLVVRIRNMRAELKVQPGLQIPVFLSALPSSDVGVKEIIQGRARWRVSVEDGRIEDTEQVRGSAISSSGGVRIRIPLEGLVDLGKERARLASEIASITREMEGLQKQLSNDQFISRAPAAIVNEKRERLSELEIRLQQAQAATDRIGVGGA
jgi:valyl-tRNA synthetase